MGIRNVATGTTLAALLLLSYVTVLAPAAPAYRLMDDDIIQFGGRSSSPEVFLASGGSSSHDEFAGAIVASDNGYFVAGEVNSSASAITFGTHTYQPTSPYSNGQDVYVASLDDAGGWNFLVGADHSSGGVSFLTDLAAHTGKPIVSGYMYGPISFGSTTLNSAVQFDAFIASTDAAGNWMWAKGFQTLPNSSTDASIPQAIAVDQTGDVIVAGYFSGETDFGGTTLNVSNAEVFVAKLDGMNGALKWVVSGGGIGAQQVTDVVVTAGGDIYVSGLTQNNILFGSNSYTVVGTQDSFVLKLSSAGAFQSLTGYGIANQAVSLTNMVLDNSGNLYLGGSFEGTLAKNGWSITANKGGADLFFIKDGSTPANQWAATGGSSTGDGLQGMDITSKGELVFTSFFLDGTFSAGTKSVTGTSSSWISSLDADVMIGGLTASGGWSWLDATQSNALEVGWDIAVNASDVAAVVGSFAGPTNQNTITKGTTSVTSTGGWDAFVWAIDPSLKADSDNDGIPDYTDNCPNDSNPLQENTDGDAQGDACDSDDDNDGLTDNSGDDCPRGGEANWDSTQDFADPANSTDWDRDGCKDGVEDNDMDNDGVANGDDTCPRSSYQPPRPTWQSDTITDVDGDGCRDADEDDDDDGDGFEDVSDDCPTVVGNSTLGEEGCLDTDGDGWSNNFDDCPTEAGNSTLNGKNACPDLDGDGWANVDDDFINDPSQWSDADGDGYGDNPEGTTPDECPAVSGTSTIDRLGCEDSDGDGYSNPDAEWDAENGADAFVDDPTQWSDFDGDGYGDNYANTTWEDRNPSWPGEYSADVMVQDACPTQEGTSWQNGLLGCPDQDGDGWYNLQDAFPNDPTQWEDTDGDGYGDNASGNDPDACPTVAGTSNVDRLGCSDSDGDGYSDPEITWTPLQGADAFSADPTQWADEDGDFYGDNRNGERPDACPTVRGTSFIDRFGCEDSDGDGISNADTFWTLEQGADACPVTYGNSTADRIGCLDTDGDNYSDPTPDWRKEDGADAYPEDPMRWIFEPEAEGTLLASPTVLIGGGVALLVVLALLGVLMRRRGGGSNEGEWAVTQLNVEAPAFAAQPAYTGTPQTVMPTAQVGYAQPVAHPAYAQAAPQPDPAREYYNGLIAQGYPHEDAVRYTQQYFNQFSG